MLLNFQPVFLFILNISFKAGVMVVLILTIKVLFKDRLPASWNYYLWLLLILRLLLPDSLGSQLSIFNYLDINPHEAVTLQPSSLQPNTTMTISNNNMDVNINGENVNYLKSFDSHSRKSNFYLLNWLSFIWIAGVLLISIAIYRANRKFAITLKKNSKPCMDSSLLEQLETCKQIIGINRRVPLMTTSAVCVPSLYGLWRPRILIPPKGVESFSTEEWKHVFLHELAHLKRKDIGVNWIVNILVIIHWFNPLLWLALRKMREDQEIASDYLAVSSMNKQQSQEYAAVLIKWMEYFQKPPLTVHSVSMLDNKRYLKRRIQMIIQKRASYKWSLVGMLALALLAAVSLTSAKAEEEVKSEDVRVKEVVTKTFEALQHFQDADTFLSHTIDVRYSQPVANKLAADVFANKGLNPNTLIDFKIEKIEKLNVGEYKAYLSKTYSDLGKLPVYGIPVVKRDGEWLVVIENIEFVPSQFWLKNKDSITNSGKVEVLAVNENAAIIRRK
ncbi:M56 family metallopeptidase [Paenibacillus chitinolyticus]|uniref:M56 family metallopeptidase n=1 Tax=Paenibacillus chitinolyticus TaxID=79263 RepID=UPI00355909BA